MTRNPEVKTKASIANSQVRKAVVLNLYGDFKMKKQPL